jgi:aspartate aminotransferase-like enzyme
MSDPFKLVMKDLNRLLKETYHSSKVAIIPGSGTFGMEAVARQFANNEHVLVVRNGWFSYRWTEIFDMGNIPASHTYLKAKSMSNNEQYSPCPIEQVVDQISKHRPAVVFAPHVETSTGIILPDNYIKKMAEEVHKYGGLLVLDCIASGCIWVDMEELGIDVVISAPQKGWTGPACCGLVMMSERAVRKMAETKETSFSMSLKKWSGVMDMYENGGFAYHTTLPTDALRDFHEITVEMMKVGFSELNVAQRELGSKARELMDSKGLKSVAAPGFEAPGVLVYYSPTGVDNPFIVDSFKVHGLQIATGVPWKINEPEDLKTFRTGLFGLDKMINIPATLNLLNNTLDKVLEDCRNVNLCD